MTPFWTGWTGAWAAIRALRPRFPARDRCKSGGGWRNPSAAGSFRSESSLLAVTLLPYVLAPAKLVSSVGGSVSMTILETQGLTRRFGDFTAVDGLTIAVEEGEALGPLGPKGAGKTTATRMLTTLRAPPA